MNTELKKERLLEFIQELKKNGFKVYAPENITTYCNFVKDDKIGYMQINDYGSFDFSSVHKPCRECGTGYGIYREVYHPTIEMANDAINTVVPGWDTSNYSHVKKYKNWNEYVNYPINTIIKKVEY